MNGATYYYRYRRETPQEQARLRVVYALTGTAFFFAVAVGGYGTVFYLGGYSGRLLL